MTKLSTGFLAILLCVQEIPAIQADIQFYSESGQANDPASNIMMKVISRTNKNETEKKKHLVYLRTYESYNLTPDGKLKNRDDQSVTQIRPNGDKSLEEVVVEDGKPVQKKSSSDSVFDLESILEKYQFTLANPSIIVEDGKDYIVINFKPKNEKLVDKTYLDRIANDLKGTFYIDIENLYVKKVYGTLVQSLSFGGLVKVTEMTVHIEQEQRPDLNNIVVVNSVTAIPKYSINYILYRRNHYQRRTWSYSDYMYVQ